MDCSISGVAVSQLFDHLTSIETVEFVFSGPQTATSDEIFCRLHRQALVELNIKDTEFLKAVHIIVPVRPSTLTVRGKCHNWKQNLTSCGGLSIIMNFL